MTGVAKADAAVSRRTRKEERVNFRVSPEVKQTLLRAAEVSGRSLSDFVVSSAFDAAQKTIEAVENLRLAKKDRAVFLEALSNPPAPNDALKAAAARYQKLVG